MGKDHRIRSLTKTVELKSAELNLKFSVWRVYKGRGDYVTETRFSGCDIIIFNPPNVGILDEFPIEAYEASLNQLNSVHITPSTFASSIRLENYI